MAACGWNDLGAFDSLAWPSKMGDVAAHMILPVTVLVLGALPVLLRHVRSAVTDVLDAPFLRAAEGHGISRRRLLYRYALPAAANPIVFVWLQFRNATQRLAPN
ncbi:MAG TPA: ABC transporter permease subunit [Candidatus Acidoferrum sp.]